MLTLSDVSRRYRMIPGGNASYNPHHPEVSLRSTAGYKKIMPCRANPLPLPRRQLHKLPDGDINMVDSFIKMQTKKASEFRGFLCR